MRRRSRDERGFSKAAIGRAIGISGEAIAAWKTGGKVPDLDTIVRLALVLEVDPGWLAFGSASKAPAPSGEQPDGNENGGGRPPRPPAIQPVPAERPSSRRGEKRA